MMTRQQRRAVERKAAKSPEAVGLIKFPPGHNPNSSQWPDSSTQSPIEPDSPSKKSQ